MSHNHLISEKSPYLQQHAHNPVDWYPWGAEAFEKATREDKPIFLSIGYSTCHWCHVMERESFENPRIAGVLNQYFVPVKVDREERPDVDRIYMTYVQAATGSGGWPMSVFLTPELKPFFGGTYFPPDNRYGRPGFQAVLESLARAWSTERAKIDQSSRQAVEQLSALSNIEPSRRSTLDKSVLDSAFYYFRRTYDSANGGFGNAPKFPRPAVFNFLFRYHARYTNGEALEMTLHTLRAMAEGGMNDQLGGGFHRYSVDERWFVPHFEKMLYDQAQLAIAYLEAHQITHDPFFASVARNTLDYVLRDMTHSGGGFYSAEDADSAADPAKPTEKSEGAFYLWTRQEIDQLLGHPEASIFSDRYGVAPEGNVHNDPHGEFTGKNILFVHHTLEQTTSTFHISEETVGSRIEKSAAKLLAHRGTRPRPHLDDKILTAWNGLMISAFAKAAQVLDEPRYLEAARRSAGFILDRMYDRENGTLLRRFRDDDAAIPGFLDDYAFLIQGLLDLYETDFDLAWLDHSIALAEKMRQLFEDAAGGGFFSTPQGDERLLLRIKDDYDGAEPAGNSVALLDLLRLAEITKRSDFREAAGQTLDALASRISAQPMAAPQMLVAVNYYLGPARQIIIAGGRQADLTRNLLRAARSRFLPNSVVLLVDSDETRQKLARQMPEIAEMKEAGGKPTAYVCRNYACQLPTSEVERFGELLQ
ncbi:MAG: thioredoxin domain-containing protein [Bryobacteraceae bacterium]